MSRNKFLRVVACLAPGLLKQPESLPGIPLFLQGDSLNTEFDYRIIRAEFHSYRPALSDTPYRIASSSTSSFMSFRLLNLMQYPVTSALPIFLAYALARYFLSLMVMI